MNHETRSFYYQGLVWTKNEPFYINILQINKDEMKREIKLPFQMRCSFSEMILHNVRHYYAAIPKMKQQ